MTVEAPGLAGGAGAVSAAPLGLARAFDRDRFGGFFDRERRAQDRAGAGGQGRGLGFGLVEGGEQGVVVGGFGVAGEEVGAAGAGGAGGDGGVDQFAGALGLVQDYADALGGAEEGAFVAADFADRDLRRW